MLRRIGARVLLARCGISGLDEFHRNLPDLTLVQDLLPGVPGLEVCRRIKESEEGAERSVVLFCGGQSHSALVATGCDAYIEKPYPDEELLKVLAAMLPGAPVVINPESPPRAAERPVEITATRREASPVPPPGSIEAEIAERIDSVFDSTGWVEATVAPSTGTPEELRSRRRVRAQTASRPT